MKSPDELTDNFVALFLGKIFVELPTSSQTPVLRTEIQIPKLLSNALITYRLTPSSRSTSSQSENACEGIFIGFIARMYPADL